jgi:hypothetical protein
VFPFYNTSASNIAWAKASGASCGRLWPIPPGEGPVLISAREFVRIRTGLGMRRAVCIALERDRRYADSRSGGEPSLHFVIRVHTFSKDEPPAVVVNHNVDVIIIVKCCCSAIERRIVEVPARRRGSPDQLRKITPILLVAGPPPFRREVVLIPPLELGARRQRRLTGGLVSDQIPARASAASDSGCATWREQRRRVASVERDPDLEELRAQA